jgi:hypothetical protein
VIFQTSTAGRLAQLASPTEVAVEVESLDVARRTGQVVVVQGRTGMLERLDTSAMRRAAAELSPSADDDRPLLSACRPSAAGAALPHRQGLHECRDATGQRSLRASAFRGSAAMAAPLGPDGRSRPVVSAPR